MTNLTEKEMAFYQALLKKKDFLSYLFNYACDFKESQYVDEMDNFSEEDWSAEYILLIKGTSWLLVDDEGEAYGLLDGFIAAIDSEAEYYCYGKGFHNLPTYFMEKINRDHECLVKARANYSYGPSLSEGLQDRSRIGQPSTKEWLLENKGIDIDKLFEEYKKFCRSFGFEVVKQDREKIFAEFEEYLKNSAK